MDLVNVLKQLGFNENKAKVYLACLELGRATASDVAKKSSLIRTTVYKILEELVSEGLVEADLTSRVKTFIVLPPVKLIALIDSKKSVAQDSLPFFLEIFSSTKYKPKIRFYEGKEGIKKVFEDALDVKEKIVYTFSPIKDLLSELGATYARHYTNKRVKNDILRKALRQISDKESSKGQWEFYADDEKLKREVRFLPKSVIFSTLIQIYDNKVSFISFEKENFAFIIESRELSSFMKQLFNLLWSMSGK